MQLSQILSFAALLSLAIAAPAVDQPRSGDDALVLRDTLPAISDANELQARQSCPAGCFAWVGRIIGGQRPSNVHDVTRDSVRLAGGTRICDLPWRTWNYGEVRSGFNYRVWIDGPAANINIQAHTTLTDRPVQYRVGVQLPGSANPQWGQWRDIEEIQGFGTVCHTYQPGGVTYQLEVRYRLKKP
ncbi:hypothetical protein CSAL01_11441 [Colletotrichum salicis]|uniref:Uncharacterized protein n=1 Tax=Colletotrichum salicis TaxID=1209931 RepID=A0A135SQV6_9PEZI|nr:hypothetical protein CSAL01_11441 [Colletotrichum salicis]